MYVSSVSKAYSTSSYGNYIEKPSFSQLSMQRNSPGLVDFAIGPVVFVFNLPDGQVLFFGKFKLPKDCNQFANQRGLGAS